MRSVWSGNLAFGLVSIPVKLGSAVSSHKIGFRQIHLADHGRVRYQKTCELDEKVLSASDIGRAYETPDEQLVEITDEDLKALPLPTAKTIEVSGFLDLDAFDPLQIDSAYFLAPASAAANKPYVLMREALARSGKAAVGKFAMRNAEHLALIRARDDILVLQTLRWPDELNSPAEAAPKGSVKISDAELRLADTLIEALGAAELADYQDEYAQAVETLVNAKLEGAQLPEAGEEAAGGKVVDLMAALRASVEAAQESRAAGDEAGAGPEAGGGEGEATVTELKRRAGEAGEQEAPQRGGGRAGGRKSTAKKAPAEKTSARKAPAKKAPAKKAATGKSTSGRKSTPKRTG